VYRTDRPSELRIPAARVPSALRSLLGYRSPLIVGYPWLAPLVLAGISALVRSGGALRGSRPRRALGSAGLAAALVLAGLSCFAAGQREDLRIGPIPAGTPVNLLANLDASKARRGELLRLVVKTQALLAAMQAQGVVGEEAVERLGRELGSDLLRLSKSPDLIEDRGHWFGTRLPDADKRALIAFLRTF
jgi:hypothetical protein